MDIAPETLREILAAVLEAQAYVLHPASITPCASKRVATHRVPNHKFHALTGQLCGAAKTLSAALQET